MYCILLYFIYIFALYCFLLYIVVNKIKNHENNCKCKYWRLFIQH